MKDIIGKLTDLIFGNMFLCAVFGILSTLIILYKIGIVHV